MPFAPMMMRDAPVLVRVCSLGSIRDGPRPVRWSGSRTWKPPPNAGPPGPSIGACREEPTSRACAAALRVYAAWDTAGLLEGRSATVPVLSRELHEMQSSDLLPRSPSLVPGREGVGDLRVAHPASGPLSKFTLDNLVAAVV